MSQAYLKGLFPFLFLAICLTACTVKQNPSISIITDTEIGKPVTHGLNALSGKLEQLDVSFEYVNSISEARGTTILVAGLIKGGGEAARLNKEYNQVQTDDAESLSIWKGEFQERCLWVINGSDDRGLMYALLDVAERITWSKDKSSPLSELSPVSESPDVSTRAVSLYTMNRAYWESRFYDEKYWTRYMDLLAKNRFNTVVLIFGYENAGFLAPCYPYFFSVDGFPEVKMENMTAREQEKNLSALNRMVTMAHERGLEIKVGIWDHIYRGGIQNGGLTKDQLAKFDKSHLVHGLNTENLSSYTKAALKKFIQRVPGLDGIQFRMHNESGLERGTEMEDFWTDIFQMLKAASPELQIDLRAKELPESIIQVAKNTGLHFTITTKYWMEQMGLPYHPTHINRENQFERRHGYADMLRYPQEYSLHWRLWSGGTQRILLWGNPQYVKRFVGSTHLYKGEGFEINEPLATKMEAQPHNMQAFSLLNPPYVYYDYEFERYWHFFQVYGRLGYDPESEPEIWEREFKKRFGEDAGPLVQEALHKASRILPRIVAACSPYGKFPTTCGWAEKQRYGDLPIYAMAEGSDIQQFASFDTQAQLLIEGGENSRCMPSSTSIWFAETSQELNKLIAEAAKFIKNDHKEFFSTITDLKILSNLALYHSHRIKAAVSYRIYKRSGDPFALDDAIGYEQDALAAWGQIVEVAGEVYSSDLKFGVKEIFYLDINHHLTGHWKDEYGYLKAGLDRLKAERDQIKVRNQTRTSPAYSSIPSVSPKELFEVELQRIEKASVNQDLQIQARIKANNGIKWVKLRFRPVNQHLDYMTIFMEAESGSDVFQASVPASRIDPKFDFQYFIEVMDQEGHGKIYPDFETETPYVVVNTTS